MPSNIAGSRKYRCPVGCPAGVQELLAKSAQLRSTAKATRVCFHRHLPISEQRHPQLSGKSRLGQHVLAKIALLGRSLVDKIFGQVGRLHVTWRVKEFVGVDEANAHGLERGYAKLERQRVIGFENARFDSVPRAGHHRSVHERIVKEINPRPR